MQEQRKNKLCHGKTPRGILPVNSYDIITNGENNLITGGNL